MITDPNSNRENFFAVKFNAACLVNPGKLQNKDLRLIELREQVWRHYVCMS